MDSKSGTDALITKDMQKLKEYDPEDAFREELLCRSHG